MTAIDSPRILFIINPKSGNSSTNWAAVITDYFRPLNFVVELFVLPAAFSCQILTKKINYFLPTIVVAVGGDGTIKLVAECLLQTNILLGIIPAGSANGLAKELGISTNITQALDVI
ncbi:MAG: acylglycerol kinase family protein, partial [Pedobacter sp.]|nr:acylglycerol kinase family protein [Chitinophagaceae bacterium]